MVFPTHTHDGSTHHHTCTCTIDSTYPLHTYSVSVRTPLDGLHRDTGIYRVWYYTPLIVRTHTPYIHSIHTYDDYIPWDLPTHGILIPAMDTWDPTHHGITHTHAVILHTTSSTDHYTSWYYYGMLLMPRSLYQDPYRYMISRCTRAHHTTIK